MSTVEVVRVPNPTTIPGGQHQFRSTSRSLDKNRNHKIVNDDNHPPSIGSSSSSSQRQSPSSTTSQCPLAAQKNVGLFDASRGSSSSTNNNKDKFRNVILLVACNYAYYDMLQNWEYLAKQLNLQWAVLALDEELYNVLGPERAIYPGEMFSVSGTHLFRQGGFNKLSCNKMRLVLSVAEDCGMDVVFSDVDNVFLENPFDHDFGRLIKSGRYDYIYQSNILPPQGKPLTDQCLQGIPRPEANTGFYFMSHNSSVMKTIVNATLDRCFQSGNKIDDQKLFWEEFWKVNKTSVEVNNKTFHHCNVEEYLNPSKTTNTILKQQASSKSQEDVAINYCCLDPYHYPIGGSKLLQSENPITYHANFAAHKEQKINKLRRSRWDHYGWNDKRIVDHRRT